MQMHLNARSSGTVRQISTCNLHALTRILVENKSSLDRPFTNLSCMLYNEKLHVLEISGSASVRG